MAAALYSEPPPAYETVVELSPSLGAPYVPPRYMAAQAGRNSITYGAGGNARQRDTTRLFLIDNKSADIESLNYQNDRSNYVTTVIQNDDFSPYEASTQTINFDDRSNWGAEFRSALNTNLPNVTDFMRSNSFRAKLMVAREGDAKQPRYEWVTLTLPEGNFSSDKVIDLMNNAVAEHYAAVASQHGVAEDDIGVKFDTRNFRLGFDPRIGLNTDGQYTHEAFHADIVLLPGCAVDFTRSRLNNMLGIRKRLPFRRGFVISYETLVGGNIPALADPAVPKGDPPRPLTTDAKGRSYHVGQDPSVPATFTAYRSWYLAYNYGPRDGPARTETVLTTEDITGGIEQVYWSLPDVVKPPITFRDSQLFDQLPVVAAELMPVRARTFYNTQAVYAQLIQDASNRTHAFNPFPEHQILMQPPASTIAAISENVPSVTNHGVLPIKNHVPGAQRVTITDARRRTLPYVYKTLGVLSPKVLSSATL
ncbi:penton base [Guinea pig adenovirus 1]|uniref:Penton base n=1 Tax=Guinea pig adenovirus 1 TaxID=2847100 RepID=A0AC61LZW1_9ADEN|nr:penton base [Guinea pig adenovirus]QIZ64157.1 penton base [Guinea pig adenovirus 1]QIZ64189.1 penton base [Guinea pig adenovirus]